MFNAHTSVSFPRGQNRPVSTCWVLTNESPHTQSRKERADRIISSIVHYLLASHPLHEDLQHCVLDKNPHNSMYWHRGKGFHKNNIPDLPFSFQSHDNPLYQVRSYVVSSNRPTGSITMLFVEDSNKRATSRVFALDGWIYAFRGITFYRSLAVCLWIGSELPSQHHYARSVNLAICIYVFPLHMGGCCIPWRWF